MKKLLFAVAIVSFVFAGCKSDSKNGTPSDVLSAWFDAMSKKDMTAVKELSTAESQSMISLMEMGMKDTSASNEMSKYDKSKMEFGTAVITGDNAKVPVKDKASGETTNFPMKKVNGQWKVAFDKSSMMEMGMEKMKDKNINLSDSISKGMDEMKNLNMDSMKTEINKAMDSAKAGMNQ